MSYVIIQVQYWDTVIEFHFHTAIGYKKER